MGRMHALRAAAPLMLTAASGFAGLAYQIIWTQQGSLWLGHEAVAVLAVVAAFFGGMAAGAILLGRAVRISTNPLRWYIACEVSIAAWGLVIVILLQPATSLLLTLIGPAPSVTWHWSVAFGGTLLLLLPSTVAMGLALPALERLVPARQAESSSFGGLYAANTCGAMLGVLLTAFWLIPRFGLSATVMGSAAVNLACAATACLLFRHTSSVATDRSLTAQNLSRRMLLWQLAGTGLLGIGFEVVALRVMSQVTEETVYTFACALAVYLAGTTLGAAAYQRWWVAPPRARSIGLVLMSMMSGAVLIGALGLWSAEILRAALATTLGHGLTAAISIEAALAMCVFALPTFFMGALFTHLCAAASKAGAGFGEATGWNGAGAALAPVLFGVVAVPALGAKWSLLLLSAGYLVLLPWRSWGRAAALVPAIATAAVGLLTPPLAFVNMPPGGKVLSYHEGTTAAVSVVEDRDGVARLRIDNRQQEGSSASYWFDARQAWLPLLLHPAPRQALFLGMGTGVTAAAATEDPELRVEVVELLPEVVAASTFFTKVFDTNDPAARARVVAADARRFVKSSDIQVDVIVSDNFHPARSGAGSLYTVEHFRAVKRRLAAGGVFCQWLPLHQLDLYSLRSIVRSYLLVFPNAAAILASNSLDTPVIGLIGREDDSALNSAAVIARRQHAMNFRQLGELGLGDDFAVLGSLVAGPDSLRAFASGAIANTDDRPVVAYRAPLLTYAPDSQPRDRLLQLLAQWMISADEVLSDQPSAEQAQRLVAYWYARNRYIEVGSHVHPVGDVRQMLAQVQEPLLAVLRISPDFTPAFDPLLQMANALAEVDPAAARELTAQLLRLKPDHAAVLALRARLSPEE